MDDAWALIALAADGGDGASGLSAYGLSELPAVAHLPIALALVAGFLLWVVGGRLIRPAMAALGGVVGGLAGFLILPQIAPSEILWMPSPHAGLLIGGLSGLAIGALLVKPAIAILSSGAMALAGLLAGLVALQLSPSVAGADAPGLRADDTRIGSAGESGGGSGDGSGSDGPSDADVALDELGGLIEGIDGAEEAAESVGRIGRESFERLDEDTRAVVATAYERTRGFFDDLVREARGRWEARGGRARMILISTTVVGAIAGLLLGVSRPKRAASVVSALVGAAVVLGSGVWLMHAFAVPGREALSRAPSGWVVIWLGVSLIGLVLQARSRGA